jgi:hypothetical protein
VLGYAGKVNLGKGVMAKKAQPKMKMPPLTFVPVGDYCEGSLSLDPKIPLGLRKVRHELWQEWHRYGRIKLAAALAGDISTKRDAKVESIYARRGEKDEAIRLLTKLKPSKAKKVKPMTLKKARAMAAKGFTVGYTHDGVTVTLTPENYKQPMSKLVGARLAHDAAHEAKFKDAWKCKCASHYPNGDLTKPRKD